MNIQAYIESGILEEYVLGTVSEQEMQEVECMSRIYPEIKEELRKLEQAMEKYALEHQVPPPAHLKEKIFAQMSFGPLPVQGVPAEEAEDATVVPIGQSATNARPLWSRMAVAASVLLALMLGWAMYQMSEYRQQNEVLVSEMAELRTDAEYQKTLASLYRNPNYRTVRMAGVEKSPESSVVAFWNQSTNEVLLDVQRLPVPPTGRQYQLWSIVNGTPVDMGVLEAEFAGKILKMKATQPGAAAFAITLEKAGGSPNPTLEEMYVMGNV
ncbi:anti-sigma factor [Telluribacter sp.]|jgi:anti-sigma-K factor RskA|uniref:anti-sigma factor n=1 Tax=Telluribacter sp. TaxID=1978767 RepID=UPI002E0F9B4A|nr:anti-sigma factor [Telluribacter sp.]